MPHVKKNESKESLADMFYQPLEQKLYRVLLEIVGLAMAVYFSIMVSFKILKPVYYYFYSTSYSSSHLYGGLGMKGKWYLATKKNSSTHWHKYMIFLVEKKNKRFTPSKNVNVFCFHICRMISRSS